MATSKEFVKYVVEQLSLLDNIRIRSMMGEYLVYYQDIYFGGICNERFLVKITKNGYKLIKNPKEEPPYEGAKPMFLIEELDDQEFLKELVIKTCLELPEAKKKQNVK